ncbi:DUF4252 domain-containing protein [Mesonia mobilis]|uniref:DUF4252 domain-containing protein n=1 Tax=Mesonia mobilis TaxID=369791 RepID=UPI0026E94B81|nr:DUF4252 domain-containing protein [Mesonia mobilis]
MKKINQILLLVIAVFAVACSGEPSLQKYYVENQENENFVVLDVPSSLFLGDNSDLSEEDQKVIRSIRKANVLVLPVNNNNQDVYQEEKATMETILKDEKYKVLMRFDSSGRNVKVMYLGEQDAIDEVIVYANDNTKGFAVARLLGDDMNFAAVMKLMQSAAKGDVDVNLDVLGGFGKELNEKSKKTKDSIEVKVEM